ncbi:MAG TPA: hypothetical protein VNS32_08520 [Flavisolibacter sp.]|nr:hypothetical protein [Flavisolibacter sp.]
MTNCIISKCAIAGSLFLNSLLALAQTYPCTYWPAPCPHSTSIYNARDWNIGRKNNRLPQEMEFEAELRRNTDQIVFDLARQNQWQVYEYNESDFTAPLAANDKNIIDTVPYIKRPPHQYQVTYIFIIDKQALNEWRNWYKDFRNTLEQKIQAIQADANNGAQQQFETLRKEETDHNINFRDRSTLLVKFSFNDYQEGTGIIDPTNDKNMLSQKKLVIGGTQLAVITHNQLPVSHLAAGEHGLSADDYDDSHPTDVGLMLVDGWAATRPEGPFLFYLAAYSKNPTNMGYKTVKPVTCDHVRSLALHIEGRGDNVEELMQQLNLQRLKDLVIH